MKNLLLIFLFFFGKTPASADVVCQTDPYQVLNKISQFYQNHSFIYHDLSYKLFSDHNTQIPHSIESGIFIKRGGSQYSKVLSLENLITTEYNVGLDLEEKVMMISNILQFPSTSTYTEMENYIPPGSTVAYRPISTNIGEITVKSDYGDIEETTIRFDRLTYQLIKLVFKYRSPVTLMEENEGVFERPRLEIDYVKTDLTDRDSEKLNINTYVLKSQGEWKPSSRYAGFELINNIQPMHTIK